jgi:hypothetical protein
VSSVKSVGEPAGEEDAYARSRGNSTNVTRDPHATLSLFAPRDKNVHDSLPAVVAPRTSAKPPPRDLSELFVGNESEGPPSFAPSKGMGHERPASPDKVAAPKLGAGKNYAPSRLFDNEEDSPVRPSANDPSAEHFIRPNAAKYKHFDFGDGSDPRDVPAPTPAKERSSKHGSQWQFDDFNTPAKAIPTKVLRTNDVRHWGNEDNEVNDSPIKFKRVEKPRRDAETHFEFQDDGIPEGPRVVGRPRGAGQNNGLGLYKDILFGENEDESSKATENKPLSSIANVKDRRKDFDAHFTMSDESPAPKAAVERISDNRAKAVKMMDANWSSYDQSPNQKENVPIPSTSKSETTNSKEPLSESTNIRHDNKGISIAGDGMGGKKGIESAANEKKGISITGDGMGGKKGSSGRTWSFGGDVDDDEADTANAAGKYKTGKQFAKKQTTGGDFWDF